VVDDLADLLDIDREELPWIYLIHGITGQLVPYPYALDDPKDVSPELMVLWARRTSLHLELPVLEQMIEVTRNETPLI
jgi:hypothetical protein